MSALADILALPSVKETVESCDFFAKKSLGQNFIFDLNITRRIARASGAARGGTVIEIGPGPGALTRALFLEGYTKVIAIDKDPRARGALASLQTIVGANLEIHIDDALSVEMATLGQKPLNVVANLPYNVATPILVYLLKNISAFDSLTLMFQKEVADRLVAKPRTSAYGRLSILAQWRTEIIVLFDLPPSAFVPAPKVTSSVVHFKPRTAPLDCDFAQLERTTQQFFQNRRKMLRANLKNLPEETVRALAGCGIDLTMRPEELSVEQFCHLTNILHRQKFSPTDL